MNFPTVGTGDYVIPIPSLQDAERLHSCAVAIIVPEPLVSTRSRERICVPFMADLMCFVDEMAMCKTATSNNQGLAAPVLERGQLDETCESDGRLISNQELPVAAERDKSRWPAATLIAANVYGRMAALFQRSGDE